MKYVIVPNSKHVISYELNYSKRSPWRVSAGADHIALNRVSASAHTRTCRVSVCVNNTWDLNLGLEVKWLGNSCVDNWLRGRDELTMAAGRLCRPHSGPGMIPFVLHSIDNIDGKLSYPQIDLLLIYFQIQRS